MKLKDILARELKAWPTDAIHDHCVQSDETTRVYFGGPHAEIFLSERADETVGVKVSRAEWQAAVEALKAEQAAELKWPDGAEFMGTTKEGSPKVFYRNVDGDYEYCYEHEIYWSKSRGTPFHTPLIPRPTERAVEWDEFGFPSAGVLCEFTTNDGHNWKGCKILYADDLSILTGELEGKAGRRLLRKCDADVKFRPTRTQEQIAEDVRTAGINEMIRHIKDHPLGIHGVKHIQELRIHEDVVRDLWEAGYRKQVAE